IFVSPGVEAVGTVGNSECFGRRVWRPGQRVPAATKSGEPYSVPEPLPDPRPSSGLGPCRPPSRTGVSQAHNLLFQLSACPPGRLARLTAAILQSRQPFGPIPLPPLVP